MAKSQGGAGGYHGEGEGMILMEPGKGSISRGDGRQDHGDLRRIVVAFDNETFGEIRNLAVKHQTSFAAQVRLLVEWGLMPDPPETDVS